MKIQQNMALEIAKSHFYKIWAFFWLLKSRKDFSQTHKFLQKVVEHCTKPIQI